MVLFSVGHTPPVIPAEALIESTRTRKQSCEQVSNFPWRRRNGCGTHKHAPLTTHPRLQVLGLFCDFVLKLTGFPSPVGLVSALPFAGTKPRFT